MLSSIVRLLSVTALAPFIINASPGKMNVQDLAGTYASAKGDRITVEVKPSEKIQEDLFLKEYEVYVTARFSNLDMDFEQTITVGEEVTSTDFEVGMRVECEDPGCEEYTVDVLFNKGADGTIQTVASVDYMKLIDDEAPVQSEEEAKDRCAYLGQISEAVMEEDGAVTCYFSESETEFKKDALRASLR
jgi:hypothetical protein